MSVNEKVHFRSQFTRSFQRCQMVYKLPSKTNSEFYQVFLKETQESLLMQMNRESWWNVFWLHGEAVETKAQFPLRDTLLALLGLCSEVLDRMLALQWIEPAAVIYGRLCWLDFLDGRLPSQRRFMYESLQFSPYFADDVKDMLQSLPSAVVMCKSKTVQLGWYGREMFQDEVLTSGYMQFPIIQQRCPQKPAQQLGLFEKQTQLL